MPGIKRTKPDIEDEAQQPFIDEDEPQDAEADRRKRMNMLILILASSLNLVGWGVYGPAFSQWIYVQFEKEALGANFSQLNISAAEDPCFRGNHSYSPFKPMLMKAQAMSAHFSTLSTLCTLIPSFFANLLLGAYADQIGRRIIFIVPMAGNLIRGAIVCAVAYWELSTNYVLVGCVLNGLSGDYVAFVMGVYVYTADNTTKGKNRSFLMVFVNAVNFIFYHLTQLASGYFIEATGYVWPMVAGFGAMTLCFIMIVLFLPETLDKSRVKRVSLFEGIKGIFSFYFEKPVDKAHKRKDFVLLGLVFFVYCCALGSSITTIYLMNEPFCWGSRQIGYVNSAFGFGHALLATFLMRILQKFFSDESLVLMSLVSSAGHRFVFAYAEHDWHIYAAYGVGSLEVSALAVLRAILSRMVPKQKRGSLLASIAVMETATFAASGAGLNEMYSNTVHEWRGLTYFVIGCITAVSAVLMMAYKIVIYRRNPLSMTITVEEPDTINANKETDIAPISNGPEKKQ